MDGSPQGVAIPHVATQAGSAWPEASGPLVMCARNGALLTLQLIRPEDEAAMVRFHASLSDRTTYLRYFQVLQFSRRTEHKRLARQCSVDPHQLALVAKTVDSQAHEEQIVGVGRLAEIPAASGEFELALVISDAWQHQGLGSALAKRLVEIAYAHGVRRLIACFLPENCAMRSICRKLGMQMISGVSESPALAAMDLPRATKPK